MEVGISAVGPEVHHRVHITADDRERGSAVVEQLAVLPQIQLEIRRLTTGDYEVENEWTFERKTVPDFAASLLDGRLFRQAARLGRCSSGRALILEGLETDLEGTGISPESWRGALLSLGLAFHLPVLRSTDSDDTVRLLLYAAGQVRRQHDTVFIPKRRRARTLERQRLQVLAALPGVGAHRAQLLLHHFGSIEAVVLATEEELTQVPGVGEQTATRIHNLVAGKATDLSPSTIAD